MKAVAGTPYWKTIPRSINGLALVSIIVLLFKVFWLNHVVEPFEGMNQLGLVVEGLLASVLASYVFFLIVVHFKDTRDKAHIYPHVLRWADHVVGECRSQISAFAKHSGVQADIESITSDDVDQMLQRIDPKTNAPLVFSIGHYANWLQYLEHHRVRTKRHVAKIMSQLMFLEAPLVSLVTKIDDSTHFMIIEMIHAVPIKNSDLSAFSKEFFGYCVACRDLQDFIRSHPYAPARFEG